MEKVQFIVEPGDDGFRAWHEPAFGGTASAYGETMEALKKNAAESYNQLMMKPVARQFRKMRSSL